MQLERIEEADELMSSQSMATQNDYSYFFNTPTQNPLTSGDLNETSPIISESQVLSSSDTQEGSNALEKLVLKLWDITNQLVSSHKELDAESVAIEREMKELYDMQNSRYEIMASRLQLVGKNIIEFSDVPAAAQKLVRQGNNFSENISAEHASDKYALVESDNQSNKKTSS